MQQWKIKEKVLKRTNKLKRKVVNIENDLITKDKNIHTKLNFFPNNKTEY